MTNSIRAVDTGENQPTQFLTESGNAFGAIATILNGEDMNGIGSHIGQDISPPHLGAGHLAPTLLPTRRCNQGRVESSHQKSRPPKRKPRARRAIEPWFLWSGVIGSSLKRTINPLL